VEDVAKLQNYQTGMIESSWHIYAKNFKHFTPVQKPKL